MKYDFVVKNCFVVQNVCPEHSSCFLFCAQARLKHFRRSVYNYAKKKINPVKEDPNKKLAKEESSSELNPLLNRDLFCQIGKFLDLTSLLRLQSVSKKIKTHSQVCLKLMFSDSSTEEITLNPRDVYVRFVGVLMEFRCKMFANKKKFKLAQNDWKSGFFKKVNVHMIVYFYAHEYVTSDRF